MSTRIQNSLIAFLLAVIAGARASGQPAGLADLHLSFSNIEENCIYGDGAGPIDPGKRKCGNPMGSDYKNKKPLAVDISYKTHEEPDLAKDLKAFSAHRFHGKGDAAYVANELVKMDLSDKNCTNLIRNTAEGNGKNSYSIRCTFTIETGLSLELRQYPEEAVNKALGVRPGAAGGGLHHSDRLNTPGETATNPGVRGPHDHLLPLRPDGGNKGSGKKTLSTVR